MAKGSWMFVVVNIIETKMVSLQETNLSLTQLYRHNQACHCSQIQISNKFLKVYFSTML